MRSTLMLIAAMSALVAAAPPAPVGPQAFACQVALMMVPQRQLTAPSPVDIRFVADSAVLRDIHVVDVGGILYPGGNMRVVHKPDAVAIETVPVPAERPGTWAGVTEKSMYRLTLTDGAEAKAVEIGIARTPAKATGRIGLIWNAIHQPKGMPRAMSGTGGGNCAPSVKEVQ